MRFEHKKAENCFSDAENYEYRIEVDGLAFAEMLRHADALGVASVRINDKLRRPTFIAALDNGTRLKGLLGKNVIKVGFVPEEAAAQKASFEGWLSGVGGDVQ